MLKIALLFVAASVRCATRQQTLRTVAFFFQIGRMLCDRILDWAFYT
ncbi:hypothetical protein FDUTEX481_07926 [Tolypothrix sp. PCC 7601]|nr:hypothetical protein FDUTEX481_07926 [Tolypothrix sp. PCC 7601]